ncbi:hypothetical protein BS78_05G097100 [Paspalum vaginatum]|nr:hypothetical protein BS78_05G097100 [Paspalum vaginatum]
MSRQPWRKADGSRRQLEAEGPPPYCMDTLKRLRIRIRYIPDTDTRWILHGYSNRLTGTCAIHTHDTHMIHVDGPTTCMAASACMLLRALGHGVEDDNLEESCCPPDAWTLLSAGCGLSPGKPVL